MGLYQFIREFPEVLAWEPELSNDHFPILGLLIREIWEHFASKRIF